MYSGWRISELLSLTKVNIVIDAVGSSVNIMRGGVKTAAGKDRVVPIHSAILPIVKARYDMCNTHLIEHDGRPLSVRAYRVHWAKAMKLIDATHTPHDCRHTFRTWLDNTVAKQTCIDMITGVGIQ